MRILGQSGRRASLYVGLFLFLGTTVCLGWIAVYKIPARARLDSWAALPRAQVRRANLESTVRAPGRIDSTKKTVIECMLENVSLSTRGRSISGGGSSTILEIVEQGKHVKEGELICRLDSSEYEEMERQQAINVERAAADLQASRLHLEIAEVSKLEFQEGTVKERIQNYQGQITIAKADLERCSERLSWANQMTAKGYMTQPQLRAEELRLKRAGIDLEVVTGQQGLYTKFSIPKTIRSLDSRIETAQAELTYQQLRYDRYVERLEFLKKQIAYCTIRAPHDGMIIYANDDNNSTPIEVGARVRQKQDLFYLPDLSDMEVTALLHESVVERVKPGMPVKVRVEALSDYELQGEVISISHLPLANRSWRSSDEIKNYDAKIKLHETGDGILPGMSAEVEVLTDSRPNALIIPVESLVFNNGRENCYVASPAGLVRRSVKLGRVTMDYLEVTEGLNEGEEILTNPALVLDGRVQIPIIEEGNDEPLQSDAQPVIAEHDQQHSPSSEHQNSTMSIASH